jgi:hypothetical protein
MPVITDFFVFHILIEEKHIQFIAQHIQSIMNNMNKNKISVPAETPPPPLFIDFHSVTRNDSLLSVNSDHRFMPSQSVFHKKTTSLEIPERRLSDEPSKRTLSTSIFPAPSRIPRTFQVCELESQFPTFWHDCFERTADGELLFTRDQVDQIREILLKERRDQLVEESTMRHQHFVSQPEQADRAARSSFLRNPRIPTAHFGRCPACEPARFPQSSTFS